MVEKGTPLACRIPKATIRYGDTEAKIHCSLSSSLKLAFLGYLHTIASLFSLAVGGISFGGIHHGSFVHYSLLGHKDITLSK